MKRVQTEYEQKMPRPTEKSEVKTKRSKKPTRSCPLSRRFAVSGAPEPNDAPVALPGIIEGSDTANR